jgi:hypothetical protein
MAQSRLACGNCGNVAHYEIPFRARIVSYCAERNEANDVSYLEVPLGIGINSDHQKRILPCANCGVPKLEVSFWEEGSKNPTPLREYQLVADMNED